MLNVVAIMGRLARDPELRQTTTGKSVASFTIACDRGRRDANGQNVADWIPVTAWDRTAEFVCKYFQKGSMIAVQGSIQTGSYEDKNGIRRKTFEIVADNVSFCGSKNEGGASQRPVADAAAPAAFSNGNVSDFTADEDDDDLPF